jgi:hypothetical protein
MPFIAALTVLNVLFIVHAARSGRFTPWGWIMLALPGIGMGAYVLVELVPEWLNGRQGQRARRQLGRALDPERDWRALADAVEVADTIANRAALAEECLRLGYFEEARRHYEVILSRPMGDDPIYMAGKARGEFGAGKPEVAVATLDALRARFPDYQSAEAHLLYARALEESGRSDEALAEYEAVSNYYPGAEPKVRHGVLLHRLGRQAESRALLSMVVAQLRRSPKHAQQLQAEWITLAEKTLKV